jgi:hypothetical protein
LLNAGDDVQGAEQRIGLEEQQLQEELREVNELIPGLIRERDEEVAHQRQVEERFQHLTAQLGAVRQAIATVLPPDLTILDMERGRLEEKLSQLQRLHSVLALRDQMSIDIDQLLAEVAALDSQADAVAQTANFESAADELSYGMTTYLNQLTTLDKRAWTQGQVGIKLQERRWTITVGRSPWTRKLGGTMTLYFLLSYHYALLSLSNKPPYHYPGLVVLDLPPTLEEVHVRDQENYVVEPFVRLTTQSPYQDTQVIVTGAAFEGLAGVNRIDLHHVWR